MYTELVMAVELKLSTPPEVLDPTLIRKGIYL